jgi:V8-like Glu-specific endopeptidase
MRWYRSCMSTVIFIFFREFNMQFKLAAIAVAAFAAAAPAMAGQSIVSSFLSGSTIERAILAGDGDQFANYDPLNRVDQNVLTSPFSGVVSINIRFDIGTSQEAGYICSGALLDSYHVLTAAHCIDANDKGTPITLNASNDVRVVFNHQDPGKIISASKATMHSDYNGFNKCADGSSGCVNDDLAIIRLSQAAPTGAARYGIWNNELTENQPIIMAGYGTSGTGLLGHLPGTADFFIKKTAENSLDAFDRDDEQDFAGGPKEVWYADFDGVDFRGQPQDSFCQIGLYCSDYRGLNTEGNIGPGDSGGPSFVVDNGMLFLAGNNTFGGNWPDQVSGTYGTYFGGMALAGYSDWISEVTAVPEPQTYALMLTGLLAVGALARRRNQR